MLECYILISYTIMLTCTDWQGVIDTVKIERIKDEIEYKLQGNKSDENNYVLNQLTENINLGN